MKGTVAGNGFFGFVESPIKVELKLIQFMFHTLCLCCFHSELSGWVKIPIDYV
jgi:hypothetical protein